MWCIQQYNTITYITAVTEQNINEGLHLQLQRKLHISPSQVSYGVSCEYCIWGKN